MSASSTSQNGRDEQPGPSATAKIAMYAGAGLAALGAAYLAYNWNSSGSAIPIQVSTDVSAAMGAPGVHPNGMLCIRPFRPFDKDDIDLVSRVSAAAVPNFSNSSDIILIADVKLYEEGTIGSGPRARVGFARAVKHQEAAGSVIGKSGEEKDGRGDANEWWEIESVYVFEPWRRRGFGRVLLRSLLAAITAPSQFSPGQSSLSSASSSSSSTSSGGASIFATLSSERHQIELEPFFDSVGFHRIRLSSRFANRGSIIVTNLPPPAPTPPASTPPPSASSGAAFSCTTSSTSSGLALPAAIRERLKQDGNVIVAISASDARESQLRGRGQVHGRSRAKGRGWLTGKNVIVVGAGLAGLTASLTLLKAGASVILFEANSSVGDTTDSMLLFPNATSVLRHLGVCPELYRRGVTIPTQSRSHIFGRFINTEISNTINNKEFIDTYNSAIACFWRADVLNVLFQACVQEGLKDLPPNRTSGNNESRFSAIFKMKAISYTTESDGRVTVQFEDSHRFTADLLIAADGTQSRLRHNMLHLNPIYSGYTEYRNVVEFESESSKERVVSRTVEMYAANSSIMTVNGVGSERASISLFLPQNETLGEAVGADEFRSVGRRFSGQSADVVEAVVSRFKQPPIKKPLYVLPKLPTFVFRRTALIGSAAHTCLPSIGHGDAFAVEDAYVLTAALCWSVKQGLSIDEGMVLYDRCRRGRTQAAVDLSRQILEPLMLDSLSAIATSFLQQVGLSSKQEPLSMWHLVCQDDFVGYDPVQVLSLGHLLPDVHD